jgi:hypothetical protein
MYLAKFDALGNVLWAKQSITKGNEFCTGLAVDPCGDVRLAVVFENTFAYGNLTFTSRGGTDVLTLKYSPQGNLIWGSQLGGSFSNGPSTSSPTDYITGPVIDANGNTYICARLMGVPTLSTNSGTSDFYSHLVSYSPDGSIRWTRINPTFTSDMAASTSGSLLVTGHIEYPTSFDGASVISVGSLDAYTAKLDASTLAATAVNCTTIPPFTIPNIITPNNDGLNDAFRFPGLPAGIWKLSIYSRLGTCVYHSDAYRHDWKAAGLPDGIYYYRLQASGRPPHNGWVEVVR